jgi:hypothetical protein
MTSSFRVKRNQKARFRPQADLVRERLDVSDRRKADIAYRGLGRLSWPERGSSGVASGTTGVRAKARIHRSLNTVSRTVDSIVLRVARSNAIKPTI